MIARINTGANPSGAVLYNEYKVAHGEARFLGGANAVAYERKNLTVQSKIRELDRYAAGNPNISKPTFHVSLAFHPSEQLTDDQLAKIGRQYMDRLGYGEQPYLIYRHEDTNHPHIHIVSVSVDAFGKRISDAHQQRRSNAIRQTLEKEHGLIQAEKQGKQVIMDGLLPEQILTYQEAEAKKAIGNVVRTALSDYRFSGLETFSQFLYQHRIQLKQLSGQTTTGETFQGITFQLQDTDGDQRGQPIGPAIKASRFAFAPTHDRLAAKFRKDSTRLVQSSETTRQRIQTVLTPYRAISEADFRANLRKAGVQVLDAGQQYVYVDHVSRHVYGENELGDRYTRSRWQSAFVAQSQLLATSNKRLNARFQSGDGNDRPEVIRESEPLEKTGRPVSVEPTPEEVTLRRRVSHHYQQLRQRGIEEPEGLYFESQLIRQFPIHALTDRLVGEGVSANLAERAVSRFESYKQSQLPEIRAKEEAYFAQTAEAFLRLAVHLPISTASKQAFLRAAGYAVDADQSQPGQNYLVHRRDPTLRCSIPSVSWHELQRDQGPRLAFDDQLTKAQRSVYLALARNEEPQGIGFYELSGAHLKASIGQRSFGKLSSALNQTYVRQVQAYLTVEKPLLPQLQERGLLIQPIDQTKVQVGFYQTEPNSFVQLSENLSRRLLRESVPSIQEQRTGLSTAPARTLISLTQALDQNRVTRLHQLIAAWERQSGTKVVGLTEQERARTLQGLLLEQQPLQSIPAHPVTLKTDVSKGSNTLAQSVYAPKVVNFLSKSNLLPVQRSELTEQLGLRWQVANNGALRLVEGTTLAHPGAVYRLPDQLQTLFQKPGQPVPESMTAETKRPSLRLNEADQTVLIVLLNEQPLQRVPLTPQQIAQLNLRVLTTVLPPPQLKNFHTWYNNQRGSQIIDQTLQTFGSQESGRRLLSSLYQRGFLLERVPGVNSTDNRYRMGHYTTSRDSFVDLPTTLTRQINSVLNLINPATGFVVEGAWPAPRTPAAERMRSLARAMDAGQTPEQVQQQISRIQHRYPHLQGANEPQLVLDRLVSQPQPISSTAQRIHAFSQTEVNSTRTSSAPTAPSGQDTLLDWLERWEEQRPQKGFLDILGESASVIRPRRKRFGNEHQQSSRRRYRRR